MLRISSRQNPIVNRFREAARGRTPDVLLLDGLHLIEEALDAGVRIEVAAAPAETAHRPGLDELVGRLDRAGIEVALVSATVLDAISPLRSAGGPVALARRPAATPERLFAPPAPLVPIAADIQDPGNVGAIVRVAEAAGATGLLTTAGSADPFGWKALRGSMGSALRLPLARTGSLDDAVRTARTHGCRIVATSPRDGRPLAGVPLTGAVAILIGGEGPGLPPAALDAADLRVTIPMAAPVESLNAAVTAALILYEARRQRAAPGR